MKELRDALPDPTTTPEPAEDPAQREAAEEKMFQKRHRHRDIRDVIKEIGQARWATVGEAASAAEAGAQSRLKTL